VVNLKYRDTYDPLTQITLIFYTSVQDGRGQPEVRRYIWPLKTDNGNILDLGTR